MSFYTDVLMKSPVFKSSTICKDPAMLAPPMRAAILARGVRTPDAFLGDAARRPAWTEEALLAALTALPDGTTELMTHPGHAPSHARTSFGVEREVELAALCSGPARALLRSRGVQLCDYSTFRAGAAPANRTEP